MNAPVAVTFSRPVVPVVLQQHLDDALSLRGTRSVLARAPHVKLHQLARLDERLAAHLDGLMVAGAAGGALALEALDRPTPAALFVNAVLALEQRDDEALARLIAVAEAMPDTRAGLTSAFGWVSAATLRRRTQPLLQSLSPFPLSLGLAACAMHQVHPGAPLEVALQSEHPALRACALRVCAELGAVAQRPLCLDALSYDDTSVRFHAARAALLLGDREACIAPLSALALEAGPHQDEALALWLRVLTPADAQTALKTLVARGAAPRVVLRAVGASGDPHYLPWLLKQMESPALARLAGESFSAITGADLAALDLEDLAMDDRSAGPNDDADDTRVALDEDEGLPWPDLPRVQAWWQQEAPRLPAGARFFLGAPPTVSQGLAVLRAGTQRQRHAAATWLALLEPGRPRFGTTAPAWRQQRLLAPSATS